MEYITLNNGVKMPAVGFGTYQITDENECRESVFSAIKNGYHLIDTAQAYGNEAAVGKGIEDAVKIGIASRKEIFVTTKVWFHNYETDSCKKSLDESLEKLRLDYIDLVLLHWPFGNVYVA